MPLAITRRSAGIFLAAAPFISMWYPNPSNEITITLWPKERNVIVSNPIAQRRSITAFSLASRLTCLCEINVTQSALSSSFLTKMSFAIHKLRLIC
jgi:hypothetical protein